MGGNDEQYVLRSHPYYMYGKTLHHKGRWSRGGRREVPISSLHSLPHQVLHIHISMFNPSFLCPDDGPYFTKCMQNKHTLDGTIHQRKELPLHTSHFFIYKPTILRPPSKTPHQRTRHLGLDTHNTCDMWN